MQMIWSEVSLGLTLREWALVAGTCKASWDLHLPIIDMDADTPVTGVARYPRPSYK